MFETPLICHPDAPTVHVRGLTARIVVKASHTLILTYFLEGDLTRIRIPPPDTSTRTDGLWKHTCFEAFLMDSVDENYCEWNFSPSSQWAGYRFVGYRRGMSDCETQGAPRMTVARDANRLTLEAAIDIGALPIHAPARVALSAVIEGDDGEFSYWALAHPAGKPDFHHRDGFVLSLEGSCA